MGIIIAIIGAIFAILIVILVHELGHFLVAKWSGVKILRFSIGFGKALYTWKGKSGTEYVIAILPLGGYVKMLGEGDEKVPLKDLDKAYNRKPLLIRIAIVIAGPISNFLLAIFFFWILFMMGMTHTKPIVGEVIPHSIAQQAGLKTGDQIIKINHTPIYNWQRVMMVLVTHMGEKGNLQVTVLPRNSSQQQIYHLDLKNWKVDSRKPELFKTLGFLPYQPEVPAIINKVLPNTPAAKAGLEVGDLITGIDNQKITNWFELLKIINQKPNQIVYLDVKRGSAVQQVKVGLGARNLLNKPIGFLGVEVKPPQWPAGMQAKLSFNPFTAWLPAMEQAWFLTAFNFVVLKKMILGQISLHTLGGPITIFQTAGQASVAGIRIYLSFLAFISVTLGFINILPIPVLDGGHLLFLVIEGIAGRPIPERYQILSLKIGLIILLFLMVLATLNDIMRLFGKA